MKRFALFLLLGLTFLLRVIWLDRYPVGFTADEASFGYDAYSILKTGKDQWGQSFPLALRSFGDFKLPVYTYLTVPSVALFGLNEFAVRLPNALLGTLAVLVVYLLVKELFEDEKMSLLAAFILAISPWHLSLSRGAFEANLTTIFLPLGVLFFAKGLKKKNYLILSALAFGLNLFTYHSARYVTPLVILVLVFWQRQKLGNNYKKFVIPALIFAVFLLLAVGVLLSGGGSRVSDVAVFNPTDNWKAVADKRYEAVLLGLPDVIARLFSNKVTYVLKQFIQNFLTYTSFNFLFLQGAGDASYGMTPGYGVLYLVDIIFLFSAIAQFLKNRDRRIGLILSWILVGFIPASLSKGSGYAANRAAVVMPAIQILLAYGAYRLIKARPFRLSERLLAGVLVGVLSLSLLAFLENYTYQAPAIDAPYMSFGWKDSLSQVAKIESNYKQIVISRSFSEPQIFIAFYFKLDPNFVQSQSKEWLAYEQKKLPFVDQLGQYRLGKYIIRDINYSEDSKLTGTLLIGRPESFPEKISSLYTTFYPDGKPAILIVDSTVQEFAKAN